MEKIRKALKNQNEYKIALNRTIEIFYADKNTPEGKELDLLLPLIIDYEQLHFHIPAPDIRFK
jgi:HTH-type transcriptional regulator/antitoxin HigA